MRALDIDLVRNLSARLEIRAIGSGDGSLGTMTGYFSVFDSWYEVDSFWEGLFLERVAPGAFAQTIAEDMPGMRVLFDHGFDPQIGNKVLGPIESLSEDATGPLYAVPLFDTSYNRDLLPGLRADPSVYGSSFRFRVMEESWVDEPEVSDDNPKALPERTITRAKVMEFGPVTFPANPEATAQMNSATDQFYDQLRQRDTSLYQAAARAAGLPDFTGASVARSADRGESRLGRAQPTIRQCLDDGALRLRRIKT
jgi:HK97 family phage prohead protease